MATMAPAVRDIHATSPRDTFTGVAARSVPVTRGHPLPLPTPPNSISPALPPHGLKAQLQKARLDEAIDSDLDLHEAQDAHGPAPGSVNAYGSPPFDSAGTITPSMLAKYHLPEILLNHGPLAIRHVMGYLTTCVPGFAGIPPAKARRLVVGALEGRGSGGEGGGLEGDVEFEKVGWGRWDARRRGQPRRASSTDRLSPAGGDPSYLSGIPIAQGSGWNADRSRLAGRRASPGESAAFSHDDHDIMMMEHEADRMSMDGSASASCSEAPDDDVVMNDDPEDATDDEDWAAVGAVALRATSYSKSAQPGFPSSRAHTSGPGIRSASYAVGMARGPQGPRDFGLTPLDMGISSDAQERDAVEALLQLGSV